MARKFDPIDRDIIRALMYTPYRVTPSQIARSIGIHPETAIKRIRKLQSAGMVTCVKKGNRTYCRIKKTGLKRNLGKLL